jgi:hypothetical protein
LCAMPESLVQVAQTLQGVYSGFAAAPRGIAPASPGKVW